MLRGRRAAHERREVSVRRPRARFARDDEHGVVAEVRESDDRGGAASYFLGAGFLLWATWQVSCLVGYWAGNIIPSAWSLEFIVPLCFLSLLVPALEDRSTRIAAVAAGVSVIALDPLPMRLSLVCAGLIGIAAGMIAETRSGVR